MTRVPQVGECPDYDGMICRRYYPGDSACQQFGGKHRCLLDLWEAHAEISELKTASGTQGEKK